MKFQRLYSDDNGESHWEDVEVTLDERSFAPPAQDIEISEPEQVKQGEVQPEQTRAALPKVAEGQVSRQCPPER